jgi:hypothetical protein
VQQWLSLFEYLEGKWTELEKKNQIKERLTKITAGKKSII